MTTIAYRDGILAVDSQCVSGSWSRRGTVDKAMAINGNIYAGCGALQTVLEFFEWAATGEKSDFKFATRADDFAGLIIRWDARGPRCYTIEDGLKQWEVRMPFTARGSGAEYAIGAMAMGADAAESVRVASTFDLCTGGPIRVWSRGHGGDFVIETR